MIVESGKEIKEPEVPEVEAKEEKIDTDFLKFRQNGSLLVGRLNGEPKEENNCKVAAFSLSDCLLHTDKEKEKDD